jgi:two-component system, LytTR family, sensor kinase
MMKLLPYRPFNVLLHALAWSIVLFLPYLVSDRGNAFRIGPLPGAFFTLAGFIHMIIFYGNALFLFPKLLNRRYWWLYIVCVVLLLFVSVQIKFFILSTWFANDLPEARAHIFFPSVIVFTMSVFFGVAIDRFRAEELEKKRKAAQLGVELKFLRSQVSPHFLFNILTNLVSLARKKSDHLEESLIMLSELMRYMLYDAGKKISLEQEVAYLQSYISLQALRFGTDVKILSNIRLSDEARPCTIEPMLLIPFVENAFKHGTGYRAEPTIEIQLGLQGGVLLFEVRNKFDREKEGTKDESSGIGLANVQARLKLLYPGRHHLQVNTENNLFSIHLTLKLQ